MTGIESPRLEEIPELSGALFLWMLLPLLLLSDLRPVMEKD
jgi:hypothetical protein